MAETSQPRPAARPTPWARLVAAVRALPPIVPDAVLALVLAAASILPVLAASISAGSERPGPRAIALLLAQTLPLAWRRSRPVLVFLVVGVATIAYAIPPFPDPPTYFGILVAVYSVAAHARWRTSVWVAVAAAAGIVAIELVPETNGTVVQAGAAFLELGTAWILGDSVRVRRAYTGELEDRASQLEHERDLRAQQAVAEERGRIARELHDVVAHNVGMMVVQAEAGPLFVERDPSRARACFDDIGTTGRAALVELRRLLGVLRSEQAQPADHLAPQPGIAQLAALVERLRPAGVEVDLQLRGAARPLAAGVDLSVYRIVQEALTNTLKHAGRARASVVLTYGGHDLDLEVRDDGGTPANGTTPGRDGDTEANGDRPPTSAGTPPNGTLAGGHGQGLIGMHERVSLLGGQLQTGPGEHGGFVVHARIPVDAAQ